MRIAYDNKASLKFERCRVEVIGFDFKLHGFFRRPLSISSYHITHFHTATEVYWGTRHQSLLPETVIIIPPHCDIRYGSRKGGCRHSWARVSGSQIKTMLTNYNLPIAEPILLENKQTTIKWLKLLHEELVAGEDANPHIVYHLFGVWLNQLARQHAMDQPNRIPTAFIQAKQKIQSDYLQPLALRDIAQSVGLSEAYLCVGFRKHFGVSPIAFLIRLRMLHAVGLLENIDLNISEVAALSGYDDHFHFSKLFKKHCGMSPNQYRKEHFGM